MVGLLFVVLFEIDFLECGFGFGAVCWGIVFLLLVFGFGDLLRG